MKIVKVDWQDSQTMVEIDLTLEEVKGARGSINTTIGYVLDEDDERIILSNFVLRPLDRDCDAIKFKVGRVEELYRYIHLIPKGMIRKIVELKEMKNEKRNNVRRGV